MNDAQRAAAWRELADASRALIRKGLAYIEAGMPRAVVCEALGLSAAAWHDRVKTLQVFDELQGQQQGRHGKRDVAPPKKGASFR